MKDIVSYETAVRLKEAGFPQPTPEAGQMWYYTRFPDGTAKKNVLCILAHEYPYQDNLEALPLDGGERICNPRNTQIYAPTATDILRELNFHHLRPLFGHKWAIHNHYELGDSFEICTNENPAEAAAEAWLKINEK